MVILIIKIDIGTYYSNLCRTYLPERSLPVLYVEKCEKCTFTHYGSHMYLAHVVP